MYKFLEGSVNSDWHVTVHLRPHPRKDHDAYAVRPNNCVVGDGATPLDASWGKDLYHWGNTVANLMGEYGQDLTVPLPAVWADAVAFANTLYQPAGMKRTMSCSHARFGEKKLDYCVVGDTKLIIEMTDGSYREIFDTRLFYWEDRADRLIDEGELTGPAAAWHNRLRANTLGGYYVVGDQETVGSEALSGSVSLDSVSRVLLCSDGFWRTFTDPKDMFDVAATEKSMSLWMKTADMPDDLTAMVISRA